MQQLQPGWRPVGRPPTWLWVMPLVSCGLLAFVPPIVVAAKLKQPRIWRWAVGLALVWFAGFALVASQPQDSDNVWSNSGGLLYFVAWVGSIVFVLVMGPKADWFPQIPLAVAPAYDYNSVAIAGVQLNRQRREAARQLARRDPGMARDLRIGRPDLPREYDDGGLVDVNSAPEEALTRGLGLSAAQSAKLIEVRQQLSRFEHLEDLVNFEALELGTYDHVKDRIILL